SGVNQSPGALAMGVLDRHDLGLNRRTGIASDIDAQKNLAIPGRSEVVGVDLELHRRDLPCRGNIPGHDRERAALACAQELTIFQRLERKVPTAFLVRLLV